MWQESMSTSYKHIWKHWIVLEDQTQERICRCLVPFGQTLIHLKSCFNRINPVNSCRDVSHRLPYPSLCES